MFDSCVSLILDYCLGVCGYNKLNTVQNRAIKLFRGQNHVVSGVKVYEKCCFPLIAVIIMTTM